MDTQTSKNWIWIVVLLLLLVGVGFWFWNGSSEVKAPGEEVSTESSENLSTTDTAAVIETELNATNIDELDKELQGIDADINSL